MENRETYLPIQFESAQETDQSVSEVREKGLVHSLRATIGAGALSLAVILAPQAVDAMDRSDDAEVVAADTQRAELRQKNCPTIIAHRQSEGRMHKPDKDFTTENTVWAARRAQMLGADGGEFDNRETKPDPVTQEKEVVVMHDGTVDRTTDGHGKVANKTLRQIMRLRTPDGSPVPISGTGEYLRDILSTGWANTRNRAKRLKANILNYRHQVEIKDVSNIPAFVRTVHDVVREKQGRDPSDLIMWTTDERTEARQIHRVDPDAEIGMIFFSGRPSTQVINTVARGDSPFTSFNVHEATVQRSWVMDARRKGMDVLARTVNDVKTAERVIKAGVTYIVTDNVDKVNAWNLDRLGICKAVRKNMPVITPPEPTPTPTPTPTETPTVMPTETASPTETPTDTPTSSPVPIESSPTDAATLSEVSTASVDVFSTTLVTATP